MIRIRVIPVIIACSTIIILAGNNPEPLSIKDAVQEAMVKNPDIKSAYKNIAIAQGDVTTAELRANPSLTLTGDILPWPGEEYYIRDKYYGISVSFPVDLYNKRGKHAEAMRGIVDVTRYQHLDVVRQVKLKVEAAFYNALALRDKVELANENLHRLDEFVALNKYRAQQSEIASIDVTRSELIRDQYSNEVKNLQSQYRSALIDLQVLLGRTEFNDSLALSSDIEEIMPPDSASVEESVVYALEHRPDYIQLKKQLDAERVNKNLQEVLAKPDLSISGDYSNQQQSNFLGMSFNISLPVFNRNQGEIEKSEVRLDQLQEGITAMQASVRADIMKSREEIFKLWDIVQHQISDLIPKSKQVLKTVEYSYRTGNTPLLDYLEAQRSYNETIITYTETLLQYHISQSILHSVVGKEL